MAKYRITYDRNTCIASFACSGHDSKHFRPADDKTELITGKEKANGVFVLETELDQAAYEKALAAMQGCPVNAIRVEKVA